MSKTSNNLQGNVLSFMAAKSQADLKNRLSAKSLFGVTMTEELWMGARRRHCDSRTHLRHLLDRHLRPHH